jgi:putative endonuclease
VRDRQIFVYMLLCADGSYYVGLTSAGIEHRFWEHQCGRFRGYTYSRRPVTLVWSQEFQRLDDAIACERQIKGWRREKKAALARNDWIAVSALSRTANRHPSTSSG